MPPSAARGPIAPEDSMLMPVPDTLGSETLRKSLLAGVMARSQLLNIVSTPVMLLFRFGMPRLLRMMWTSDPVRMIVVFGSPGGLASMLYWALPFMNDVLLYQVFPPDEWLA
jgi:hypothetical protein